MRTDNRVDQLVQQLHAAAIQRELIEPWLDDRRFLQKENNPDPNNRRIFYAVDSDVIVLLTNPYEQAVSKRSLLRSRPGYTEIFPNQEDTISHALAWSLATFIFFKLSSDFPIFILPPIDQEIIQILAGVMREAEKSSHRAQKQINELDVWVKGIASSKMDVQYFKSESMSVLRAVAGPESPLGELRRFRDLLKFNRLFNVDCFSTEKLTDEMRNAFARPTGTIELKDFQETIVSWHERLLETAPEEKDPDLIENDAKMLARLEWINSRLATSNCRFVLITGSSQVLSAATIKPPVEDFARRFIRSPKAFLADENVLSPALIDSERRDSLGWRMHDWLNTIVGLDERADTFLDQLKRFGSSFDKDFVKGLAKRKLITTPNLPTDIERSWAEFTMNIVTAFLRESAENRLRHTNITSNLELAERIRSLRDEIDMLLKETWESVFRVAIASPLSGAASSCDSIPSRSLPGPYFLSFKKTNAAIASLIDALKKGAPIPAAAYQTLLKAAKEEHDGSMYLVFLAHAFIYAATGQWRLCAVTASLAESVARDLVRLQPQVAAKEHISGREAAYLSAVSLRKSSRRATDLQRCLTSLHRARDYLKDDQYGRHREKQLFEFLNFRFDAEESAIKVTQLCYDHFINEGTNQVSASKVVEFALSKQKQFERFWSNTGTNSSDARLVRSGYQVSSYLFIAVFICADRGELKEKSFQSQISWASRFYEDVVEVLEPSYFDKMVYNSTLILLGSDVTKIPKARHELQELFAVYSRHCILPFDHKLFEFLKNKALNEAFELS